MRSATPRLAAGAATPLAARARWEEKLSTQHQRAYYVNGGETGAGRATVHAVEERLALAQEGVPPATAVSKKNETVEASKVELWCLAGLLKEQREKMKKFIEGIKIVNVIVTVFVFLQLCAAVIVSVDSWIPAAVVGGLVACCSCGGIRLGVMLRGDPLVSQHVVAIILAVWFYIALLTVIPALLFASADEDAPDAGASRGVAGVGCFILALWTLGWGFFWYRAPEIRPVQPEQHLLGMPPKWLLRLKLVSICGESYNYCGFSFFPALPWKAMEVPSSVPHPQAVMLAGFFDFRDNVDTRFWSFTGSAAAVAVGFILLFVYRNNPETKFTVIQVFFELLSFPLIKTLTGVFSCTAADVQIDGDRFCDNATVPAEAQCMDTDPSAVCWTSGQHRACLAVAIGLLCPYYLACLHLQATAYARQSVVAIDGGWSIIATQSKFILAVIASCFGGCYPIVMAASVQVVVISQLLLICYFGTVYSSVHSLNAVRVAGLMLACVNGLFAVYILWHYRDDPAGAAPCSTLEQSSDSGSGPELRLMNDYNTFYGLVVVNLLTMGLGIGWYLLVKRSWIKSGTAYRTLTSINSTTDAKQVDYPIVKARLEAVERLLEFEPKAKAAVIQLIIDRQHAGVGTNVSSRCGGRRPMSASELDALRLLDWKDVRARAKAEGIDEEQLKDATAMVNFMDPAAPFVFDLMTFEEDSGQQLEQITLDMVLKSKALAAPNGVRLLEINVAEKSGLMVLGMFETMQGRGVRSCKTCWLPCCEKQYGVERSYKACWRPKERAMARVDIAASEFSGAAGTKLLIALKDRWWHGQRASAAAVEKALWMAKVREQMHWSEDALEDAPEELRNDRGIVLAAVKHNGIALRHASEELRNDRGIVIAAVKQNGYALQYASEELQNDPGLISTAQKSRSGM
jgi:hypothetical protein